MVPVTEGLWLAVALGLAGGLGLWSVAARLPAVGRPRLATRLAPYLLDVSAEARRIVRPAVADPVPVLGVLAAPALDLFQRAFGGLLGPPDGAKPRAVLVTDAELRQLAAGPDAPADQPVPQDQSRTSRWAKLFG